MSALLDRVEPLVGEMRKEALEDLGRRVSPIVNRPWEALESEISRLARVLEEADAWRVKDEQGAVYFKIGCIPLAMYRTLLPLFGDKQDLLDILAAVIETLAFKGGVDAYLLDRFGISSDAPDDAWNQICTNFIKKAPYGRAWLFEQGIKDHKRCFINIRECGLADLFLGNGCREVLYLICAADYLWGDALEKYHIRLERPTTLSEGADACRFQLFKMTE